MGKRKKYLRKRKDETYTPRQILENGLYFRVSFKEKVFAALKWCGFTNIEAFSVINPNSEATANSRAVMAGRYASNPNIRRYIELLNQHLDECDLHFKDQNLKIGEYRVMDVIDECNEKIAVIREQYNNK